MSEGRGASLYKGGICFITDRDCCPLTCVEMTTLVLKAGVRWVQYRDKHSSRSKLFNTASYIRRITSEADACFIMNDHPDIAVAVGADGVHLGQDDMPVREARKVIGYDMLLGISTHSVDEAKKAQDDGADYIGFGPVYSTDTKDAGKPKGTDLLAKVRQSVSIPVVAIGGITHSYLNDVIHSGAHAVAVASGILNGHVAYNSRMFLDSLGSFTDGCK